MSFQQPQPQQPAYGGYYSSGNFQNTQQPVTQPVTQNPSFQQPTAYGQTAPAYGQPVYAQQTYGQPAAYGQPQPSYTQNQPTYPQGQQTYGQAPSGYAQGQQTYPQQQMYGQSGQSYGQSGQTDSIMNQFTSNPAAQIGMQLGSKALRDGEEMVKQNINRYVSIPQLKYYFNVSNSYVLYKLQLLLFPFRHKTWSRIVLRNETGQFEGFKPPREDLNAPDLYIPVMSFVTYVLLMGVMMGTAASQQFTPDVLGMTATTSLFMWCTEVLLIRLGCYLINVPSSAPLLDLFGYCGYKYVGVIATCIAKLMTTSSISIVYSVFVYSMLCYGFFMLRSLKHIVFPDQASSAATGQNLRKKRIHFLFIVVAIQVVFAWFLL